ncbi:hypothetical protein EJF18_30155 [Clavispora lusitaniae]|uniref:Uncharacterized protein n=1 Tax=Clavispora lusitaniae TaxID=36911 RepID=A0ACD0WIA8_CLALS|nr:Vacuolar ATP synthase subunit S1 (ATP6S1) family protein [Clavispora lusitaniae]QFZ27192.1 hypothetical protein EJF14_30155 [Clavispora lusitaniae]QFZ33500.1 hypothetical protein EJF16_30155 [Clavispora lusitaniae]QFZ39171.1 hypothetical protein EJF15_30155 [Clavispora lusitaniae]QFZ44853.1 hypothetical protein EJF18_30155 [Clavispora lusitaniae]
MKILAGLAVCTGAAWAFSDTASFYSSRELDTSHHVVPGKDLSLELGQIAPSFCADGDKLHIYRVSNLARVAPAQVGGTFIKNVHYKGVDDIESVVDSFFAAGASEPVIYDIEDGQRHLIEEFLTSNSCVIVQGKPTFSKIETEKREEVEEHEGNEDQPEAVDAPEAVGAPEEGDAPKSSKKKSNLFREYQFFTPGVWSALIVSLFLVFVSSTAIGWITSIQTSYHAFEKQIDYEKKTE